MSDTTTISQPNTSSDSASAKQGGKNTERRQFATLMQEEAAGSLYRKLTELNIFDTLTNRYHSDDFNAARSEYIRTKSAAGVPVIGAVLVPIAAACAVASGFMNIKKIAASKFDGC